MASPQPKSWLERPLAAFFESVGVLVGDALTAELSDGRGWRAVEDCGDQAFWVETRLLTGDGRAILLVGEALVRSLGAKLLMLPSAPDETTDEVELAFDEIINVAIGAWNREVKDEARRWNNGVDARSMRCVEPTAEGASAPPGTFRAAGFSLTMDGTRHVLALVGTSGWLPESDAVFPPGTASAGAAPVAAPHNRGAVPPPPPAAAIPPPPPAAAVPPPPPVAPPARGTVPPFIMAAPPLPAAALAPNTGPIQQPSAPGGPGSVTQLRSLSPPDASGDGAGPFRRPVTGARARPTGVAAAVIPAFTPEPAFDPSASADIAVVDVTGVFLQWFYEQLRNPDFVFSHCPDGFLDSGDYRAVLLVHPRALREAGLAFDQKIIMRRG